jgi:hypothetical protein
MVDFKKAPRAWRNGSKKDTESKGLPLGKPLLF